MNVILLLLMQAFGLLMAFLFGHQIGYEKGYKQAIQDSRFEFEQDKQEA